MARRAAWLRLWVATAATIVLLYVSLLAMRVLWPIAYEDTIRMEALLREIPADLVASVVYAESRFRPVAVSSRGAIGLMQIMPGTAAWIAAMLGDEAPSALALAEVDLNVRYGVWYLRRLLDRFEEVEDALAAYNAGPSAVDRWQNDGTPPHAETAQFVRRVQAARPIYRFYLRCPVVLRITPSVRF